MLLVINYIMNLLLGQKITISKYATLGELYNAFKLVKVDVITTTNIGIENYIGTIVSMLSVLENNKQNKTKTNAIVITKYKIKITLIDIYNS